MVERSASVGAFRRHRSNAGGGAARGDIRPWLLHRGGGRGVLALDDGLPWRRHG